jgi:hypothetical protein
MNDTEFMQIAIEESKKGDWPYGAVIRNSHQNGVHQRRVDGRRLGG